MGYTVFSIEQSVCIDHCKNFNGQGTEVPAGGKLFNQEVIRSQYPADAQRWF
jgi:hypothetical protein